MTPNQQQLQARSVLNMYFIAELMLMKIVKDNLADDTESNQWDSIALKKRKDVTGDARKLLKTLSDDTVQTLVPMFSTAYISGQQEFQSEYKSVFGLNAGENPQDRRMEALIGELTGQIVAKDSRILRSVDDNYRRIIGQTMREAQQHHIPLQSSLQRALDRFASAGISSFTDNAGRNWGMSEYAEMATRTGLMRASLAGHNDAAIANGQDLVIISDHADECPLCTQWENKVLSITGAMWGYPECDGLFDEAVEAGLFHPNCLHAYTIFVPGLSSRATRVTKIGEENIEGYNNRQQMRQYERNVRMWKRKQEVALTPEAERRSKMYVDKWRRRIRELSASTNTPIEKGRTGPRVKLSGAAKKTSPITI